MSKIRRYRNRLTFYMGYPYLRKTVFILKQGPKTYTPSLVVYEEIPFKMIAYQMQWLGGIVPVSHDDVIKWEHFPRYWPLVRGIHRDRWIPRTKASDAELWCFSLICAWINDWVNNREAGDLKRHLGHYDVMVMFNCWAVMRVLDNGSINSTEWLLNSKSCIAYSSTSPVMGPWLLPSVRYTKSWPLSERKLTLWCQPENVILEGLVRTLSSVVHFHIGVGYSLPCQIPREVLWMCPPCACIDEDGRL